MRVWSSLLSSGVLMLGIFLLLALTSVSAAQSQTFAYMNITNGTYPSENITIMENNWIKLANGVTVDTPGLTFIYNGFNETSYSKDGRTINITVNVSKNIDRKVHYDPFKGGKHQFFYNDSNVAVTLETDLTGTYHYYIASTYPTRVKEIAEVLVDGNTAEFRDLFFNHSIYNDTLTANEKTAIGTLAAGDYVMIVTDNPLNTSSDFGIIAVTGIEVLEYKSELTAPHRVSGGNKLEVTMNLTGAPPANYRYGGVLIKKEDYVRSHEIRLESDATKDGTNITVDGISFVENWKIMGVGLTNINADTIQTKTLDIIDQGGYKGTVSTSTSQTLTFLTDDLPAGDYILSVGVWSGSDRLVAFAQKKIVIAPPPTPTPPSRGGGGGGGGGVSFVFPPEEITIHSASTKKIFSFTLLGLEVSTDLKNMTKDANVALQITDKPAKIPDPPGTVYSYFELQTNIEPENIHSASISFRVNKSWIVINDISATTIKLCRYASANGWEELETSIIKEDEDYFYYSAETPAFSLFAITGEKKVEEFAPPAPTPIPVPVFPVLNIATIVGIVAAIVIVVLYVVRRRRGM